jgi:acyl-CoA synthetase (AMP-forming)/AMP-acid ligase II
MLPGLMHDRPLLVSSLIEQAALWNAGTEVVALSGEPRVHRYTYADLRRRAKQLAVALTTIGAQPGDRIATLAWGDHRHLELCYGVPGIGAILHAVNPRLERAQLEFIMQHAADSHLFFDVAFLPLVEALAPQLTGLRCLVAMAAPEQLPATKLPNVLCYEELLAQHASDFAWPMVEETGGASLCYTSGTTGPPQGVLSSHRATLLHATAVCSELGLGLTRSDSALLAVPMFHGNACGMPYAALLAGAKLILPGQRLDGASLYELMKREAVTVALGLPTVWMSLFAHIERHGLEPARELQLKRVAIGGAAAPRLVIETFEKRFRVEVLHPWHMTVPCSWHRQPAAAERSRRAAPASDRVVS